MNHLSREEGRHVASCPPGSAPSSEGGAGGRLQSTALAGSLAFLGARGLRPSANAQAGKGSGDSARLYPDRLGSAPRIRGLPGDQDRGRRPQGAARKTWRGGRMGVREREPG